MGVSLKQFGGEGSEKIGKKSDMSLPQHGGEGGGKSGSVPGGGNMTLLNPKSQKGYCGPGRYLSVVSSG